MRKAQADLRATTEAVTPAPTATGTSVGKTTEDAIDDDGPGTKGRGRSSNENYNDDDFVPPVPPIPKDIVAATVTATTNGTAQVDGRSFKERENRNGELSSVSSSAGHGQRAEEFRWPEEFF